MPTRRTLPLAYLPPLDASSNFEWVCQQLADDGITKIVLQEICGTINLKTSDAGPKITRILRQTGLQAIACHGLEAKPYLLRQPDPEARSRMLTAHRDIIQRIADLGVHTYVLHLSDYPADEEPATAWEPVAQALDKLAPLAETLDIKLALENSCRNGYLARTPDELAAFIGSYGHPAGGACLDVAHAHIQGGAIQALTCLRPYIVTMHLHDNDGVHDQHVIPGRGNLDWARFIPHIATCPQLRHLETEAIKPATGCTLAETEQHPPGKVYALYRSLLNAPGSGLYVPE